MDDRSHLRPLERAVLRRLDEGLSVSEIATRFRMSADHIDRLIAYTKIPGRTGATSGVKNGLRPLERRVLHWRRQGLTHDEIGAMFHRSGAHIRRVEGLAYLRKGIGILNS